MVRSVAVREHNDGGFAAELERDLLIASGSPHMSLPTVDPVNAIGNILVGGAQRPRCAEADHDIDDAGGHTRSCRSSPRRSAVGGVSSATPGGERRRHRRHISEIGVPRRYETAHADRPLSVGRAGRRSANSVIP